jgi:hypothetical protein
MKSANIKYVVPDKIILKNLSAINKYAFIHGFI